MYGYLLRRLATYPLVLFAVYAVAVLLVMAAPGEGLETGEKDLPLEVLAAKRRSFNYDQPWYQRYFWTWPRRLIWDGDLPAHQYEDWTVVEILRESLPISLQLGVLALTTAVVLGVTAGIVSALWRGSWLDHVTLTLVLVGISLPTFATAAGLLLVFGLWWRVAPVGGWGSLAQAALPAIALALPYAAYIARLSRAAVIDTLHQDFVRTARSLGLRPRQVVLRHVLRAAWLPVLSYLGPAAAAIFTGSFVVEQVFVVPGIGTHVVESIHNRDQSLILATVLVYSALLISLNLIVDVLYGVIDPRIRVGRRTD